MEYTLQNVDSDYLSDRVMSDLFSEERILSAFINFV